jgi:hypothetical protein
MQDLNDFEQFGILAEELPQSLPESFSLAEGVLQLQLH